MMLWLFGALSFWIVIISCQVVDLGVDVQGPVLEKPPNVIILLADDLGYGDLQHSGHPTSRSPNIDLLAEEGKLFTHFYVTSPICSPSRASLLTGRYQVRSGVYPGTFVPNSVLGLPKNETTIAEILKKLGYSTQIVGKWHLGVGYQKEFLPGKGEYGFDGFYGLPYSHDMCDCSICFPDNGSCQIPCWEGYVSCPLFSNQDIIEQPVYLPTLTKNALNESLKFIRNSVEAGTPFFLYWPFYNIHHPQFASEGFFKQSARGPVGDSLLEMDWSVGQIMQTLKLLNIDNDTITWFTSDNGPSLQRHQNGGCAGLLRCGKATTWEGGVRVPSIVRWPGHILPGRTNALTSTLDILPTLTSITGSSYGNVTLDGIDISPVLFSDKDNDKSPRKFYAVYPDSPTKAEGPFAVIYKNFKANFYTKGSAISDNENYDEMCTERHQLTTHDPPLLFDLYRDPGERYNLGDQEKYRHIVEVIRDWRQKHMRDMQWMKSRTKVEDPKAQPCCTTPTCEPFPKCCDCEEI